MTADEPDVGDEPETEAPEGRDTESYDDRSAEPHDDENVDTHDGDNGEFAEPHDDGAGVETGADKDRTADDTGEMASSDRPSEEGTKGDEDRTVPTSQSTDGGDRDPLDVTEADIDTSEVDDEDLDRLVELLDEARDDPDAVEGRDLEDMLTVFDDAGIDTSDLDVDDLEERFDESLKVARILVTAAANTGEYAGLASIRAGSRMAEAAFTSESPRDLLEETTDIARNELNRLGLPFGSTGRDGSTPERADRRANGETDDGPVRVRDLRRRGSRLLELSADVDHEEPFHPAYVRVIEQLSADEARILRLLATEGPQPALDVRDRGLLPIGEGTLIASGLTMLDTDAGLRYEERSDIYIDNLERLGLLRVGDGALERLEEYRVLQAQPNVEAAQERARRPRTVRRSVRLTSMGVDFCRTVFPFELADRYAEDGGEGDQ